MEYFLSGYHSIKEILTQHALFSVGILLLLGYFFGKAAAKLKLPEITGFIIGGLILGDSILGVIPHHMNQSLKIVTEIALGLIALTIGGEFYWVKLKRMGKAVVIITVVQILATFGLVSVGLSLAGMQTPFALLLGAIASATAPAATVAIVQSLRAHGIFIDYLYGVVALDDAGCVILFGIIFAVVSGMLGAPSESANGLSVLSFAVLEVLLSVVIGVVSGYLIHRLTFKKNNTHEIMIITLGMFFLSTATAIVFHLSPLITNMAAGAIIINMSARNHRIFRILEPLTPPIYALFFVIAGTELQPQIIMQGNILMLGGIYILTRAIGKYGGVYTGCAIGKTTTPIRKYLGLCMLPQAGVAIGLVLLVQASPLLANLEPQYIEIIDNMVNIVLFSVFVNELTGPLLSKYAIIHGNEMRLK